MDKDEDRLAIISGDFDGGKPPGIGRSIDSRVDWPKPDKSEKKKGEED